MKRIIIFLLAITLVGCGGANSTSQPAQSTETIGLVERPTVAAGQATAEPSNPTMQPTTAIQTSAWSVIFQNSSTGSIEAVDSNGTFYQLADPTIAERRLIWTPSPDGKRIAVIVLEGAGSPKMQGFDHASLWVVGVDESQPTKLLNLFDGQAAQTSTGFTASDYPSAIANPYFQRLNWSADNAIIVTSAHEGNVDLYAVNPDNGTVRRLTNTPAIEYAATLSPDGTQLAFATAGTFGTGGGFGDPNTWRMKLSDAQAWQINPDGNESGAQVIGWLDANRVIVSTSNNGNGQMTYWLADDRSMLQSMTAGAGTGYINAGKLVFINSSGRNGGIVSTWDGTTAESTPLNLRAEELSVNPYGEGFVACQQTARTLWRNGENMTITPGSCQDLAWSQTGRLALGGNTAGSIIEPDGGVREAAISNGAILAGWHDNTVYYFAPSGNDAWQLYSYDANTTDSAVAIGTPVKGQIVAPRLITK